MVESQPSKLLVAGSIPVSRSRNSNRPVKTGTRERVKCGASAVEREQSMRAKQRSVAEPLNRRIDAIPAGADRGHED